MFNLIGVNQKGGLRVAFLIFENPGFCKSKWF
jgi:hypothetical protein